MFPLWPLAAQTQPPATATEKAAPEPIHTLEKFVTTEKNDDPTFVLPNGPTDSTFGFSKTLLETPRATSSISAELIDKLSLSAVEDLVRVVPGVFTTTRFGIQGGIDVRNVAGDTYFRGMKRLALQGNARSVLAALDNIEVVKGPPSPIFGMGKIGGYTNVVPKSGRAKTGGYLDRVEGFSQAVYGMYGRKEGSFGIGGPVNVLGKRGGYYLYGLLENSGSFALGVPIRQKIIQAGMSLDRFAGPFRLDAGVNSQVSQTSGALTGRLTQDLIDTGRYVRGTPLVNLDVNNSGVIGVYEMFAASPVNGSISANNLPLIQTWNWPRDPATGAYLSADKIPKVKGIPLTMYNYLVANPQADPTGLLRAQGPGGPLPTSGRVPVGMVLDPRTVGYDTLDMRHSAAFERELKAKLNTAYIDLVSDTNPDFTMKNQMFFDTMDQYKISNQPFSPKNDVMLVEEKFTLTKRFTRLPDWVRVNSLASVNYRYTRSNSRSSGGDYGTHRSDAMAPTWVDHLGGMTPNTTFANSLDNTNLATEGYPYTTDSVTRFWEAGIGLMFDVDFSTKTNLLFGGRMDGSGAKNLDRSGVYAFGGAGTSNANPMRLITTETSSSGFDRGPSWSVSLSQQVGPYLRPYITMSRSSVALDGSDNKISNAIILRGHIGSAELKEAGLKASFLDRKLFFSSAAYEQNRTDVVANDDVTVGAYASSTVTKGVEVELKWVPNKQFYASVYWVNQATEFTPNRGGTLLVDARTLGFQDVIDPATGKVVYPAEAFLYGGRSRIVLPDDHPLYNKKSGNPDIQVGANTGYTFRNGFGYTVGGNFFSAVDTGRLGIVQLPKTTVFNGAVFWNWRRWHVKLDLFNALDKRYFKPRTGDTLGDALAQAMPGRRWQVTLRRSY